MEPRRKNLFLLYHMNLAVLLILAFMTCKALFSSTPQSKALSSSFSSSSSSSSSSNINTSRPSTTTSVSNVQQANPPSKERNQTWFSMEKDYMEGPEFHLQFHSHTTLPPSMIASISSTSMLTPALSPSSLSSSSSSSSAAVTFVSSKTTPSPRLPQPSLQKNHLYNDQGSTLKEVRATLIPTSTSLPTTPTSPSELPQAPANANAMSSPFMTLVSNTIIQKDVPASSSLSSTVNSTVNPPSSNVPNAKNHEGMHQPRALHERTSLPEVSSSTSSKPSSSSLLLETMPVTANHELEPKTSLIKDTSSLFSSSSVDHVPLIHLDASNPTPPSSPPSSPSSKPTSKMYSSNPFGMMPPTVHDPRRFARVPVGTKQIEEDKQQLKETREEKEEEVANEDGDDDDDDDDDVEGKEEEREKEFKDYVQGTVPVTKEKEKEAKREQEKKQVSTHLNMETSDSKVLEKRCNVCQGKKSSSN